MMQLLYIDLYVLHLSKIRTRYTTVSLGARRRALLSLNIGVEMRTGTAVPGICYQ